MPGMGYFSGVTKTSNMQKSSKLLSPNYEALQNPPYNRKLHQNSLRSPSPNKRDDPLQDLYQNPKMKNVDKTTKPDQNRSSSIKSRKYRLHSEHDSINANSTKKTANFSAPKPRSQSRKGSATVHRKIDMSPITTALIPSEKLDSEKTQRFRNGRLVFGIEFV